MACASLSSVSRSEAKRPLYKVESSGKEQGLSPAGSPFLSTPACSPCSVQLSGVLAQASQTSGVAQAPLHAGVAKGTLLPSGGTGHGNGDRDLVLMGIWEGSPEDHGGWGLLSKHQALA